MDVLRKEKKKITRLLILLTNLYCAVTLGVKSSTREMFPQELKISRKNTEKRLLTDR